MNDPHFVQRRRIQPGGVRPDGSPADNDRVEIGPTPLAFAEWCTAGLALPDLPRMRAFRVKRIRAALAERELAGVLLFDPLNIRYATDTTNMQVWNAHNPFRACFVGADGYVVLWDFHGGDMLSGFNPLVREVRSGAGFFYFVAGDHTARRAQAFAGDVASLLAERAGGARRLAVDKIQIHGLRALDATGLEVHDGEELMEKVRVIKGDDDIAAMRCAVHACDRAMQAMREASVAGNTENDVWAALHAENIRRGGEWIETRLLASGPRTNPWFQECGPRVLGDGDVLAFDTDLVGCYGLCVDQSRTWLVGERDATPEQRRLFAEAYAQIVDNMALLAPGVPFRELSFGGRPLPAEFVPRRYSVKMHGVGLCDEWPSILYPPDYLDGAFDYVLEPGMVISCETYIGAAGGREGIKLEDQVLITADGHEQLTHFPHDPRLLA